MSLSFTVSAGFVRPFMSILHGACRLGDFVFLVPSDHSLEVVSVHPGNIAHLAVTVDALHLEGYRYRRPPRRQGVAESVSADPRTTSTAAAEGSSYVSGSAEQASASARSDVLASATTLGHESSTPAATRAVNGGEDEADDLPLRVPAWVLQATLLRQTPANMHALHVRYTAVDPLTAGVFAVDPLGDSGGGGRTQPEMLRLDCTLTTGVVKSYQLHLVNGSPPRVVPAPLAAYHLDVRGEARRLGSLLSCLPASSATCTVSATQGRLQLSCTPENGLDGGGPAEGAATGGGGAPYRRSRRRGWEADGAGVDSSHSSGGSSSMAATVFAHESSFTFQYFTAATGTADTSAAQAVEEEEAGVVDAGSNAREEGPVYVTATSAHPLPRKVVDVRSLKLATLLAGQLDQPLQLVLGEVGAPVVIRTGAAADSFVVRHPSADVPRAQQHPQQLGHLRTSTVAVGGGGAISTHHLGVETLPGVSITMYVAATDLEAATAEAATASASVTRVTPRASAGTGEGVSAKPSLSPWDRTSTSLQQQQQQQSRGTGGEVREGRGSSPTTTTARGSLGADPLFTSSQLESEALATTRGSTPQGERNSVLPATPTPVIFSNAGTLALGSADMRSTAGYGGGTGSGHEGFDGPLAVETPREGGLSGGAPSRSEATPRLTRGSSGVEETLRWTPQELLARGGSVLASQSTPARTPQAGLNGEQQQQPSAPQGTPPSQVEGTAESAAGRRSVLYPLSFTAFASHTGSGLQELGSGSKAADAMGEVAGTLTLTNGSSLAYGAGRVGGHADPTLEDDYGNEEDEQGGGYDEVDEELQQFLHNCAVVAPTSAEGHTTT